MKKNLWFLLVALIFGYTDLSAQQLQLIRTTHLPQYPSASSLEFFHDRLYIVGDDAKQVLIVDKDHHILDSIALFESDNYRLGKKDKADLESTILFNKNGKNYVVAFSSLSTKKRNKIILIDLSNHEFSTSTFLLDKAAVKDLNIEGAAIVDDYIVFSNRANNSNPSNQLIVAKYDLKDGVDDKEVKTIWLQLPDNKHLTGLSGISYIPESDLLLFTATTELTGDAYADGPIGDSYVGYIKEFSKQLTATQVKPDVFINLSKLLGKDKPHKIESIVAEQVNDEDMIIHLASDNDDGKSTLFKLSWKFR